MQMTPQTHSEQEGCLSGLLPRFDSVSDCVFVT